MDEFTSLIALRGFTVRLQGKYLNMTKENNTCTENILGRRKETQWEIEIHQTNTVLIGESMEHALRSGSVVKLNGSHMFIVQYLQFVLHEAFRMLNTKASWLINKEWNDVYSVTRINHCFLLCHHVATISFVSVHWY